MCTARTTASSGLSASNILHSPGKRPDDGWMGSHADVLVQGDDALIFYFTHPGRGEPVPDPVPGVMPYAHRRTSLQVARLELDGEMPVCDRDKPFALDLRPES